MKKFLFLGLEIKMVDPKLDGITHINIYSKGKTDLGKFLSNFAKCKIETKYGTFNSIEGLWHWLSIDCEEKDKEQLKQYYGFHAKFIGQKLEDEFGRKEVEDFNTIILTSTITKIKNNLEFILKTYNPNLPFEHYYIYGDKIIDVKEKYKWLLDGIKKIIEYEIKKNKS